PYKGAGSALRRAIKAFRLLARELGVAAPPAARAVRVLCEEHAGSALRAERLVATDLVPLDLVEEALEALRPLRGLLLLLRLRHHLPSLPPFFASGFFSSFFSAGLLSFFSADGFPSAFFSSFPAGFSSFAGAAGFSAAGFGAASFRGGGAGLGAFTFSSLFSAARSPLRTRICFRSTFRASSFDLYTFAYPREAARPNSEREKSTITMSRVAWRAFASSSRSAARP